MSRFRALKQQREQERAGRERDAELKRAILDDIPRFYRDILRMRVEPPADRFDAYGTPNAWIDQTPGSASLRRIQFWRDSWRINHETGKWIFMRLEPRDSGKSAIMQAECTRLILDDPDITIGYGAQSTLRAIDRATWIRGRLISDPVKKLWGSLKSKDWAKCRLTIADRSRGEGELATVETFGPGKSLTGEHPRLFALDDMIDSKNSKSVLKQSQVMQTWNDLIQAAGGGKAIFWIIGTWWRGIYHLYDHIADKHEKDAEIVIVPAEGEARDLRDRVLFGYPGGYNFPWIDEAYLERQKRSLPEEEFIGGYYNIKATDKMLFRLTECRPGDPPKCTVDRLCGANIDRTTCALYMITDPANNKGDCRGLSKAAIGVVAKRFDGAAFLVDMALDYMTSDVFLDTFMEMYMRWRPITWYAMETQGPGNMYPGWIADRFKMIGEEPPAHRPVSRWGSKKEPRIMTLYQPMKDDKLFFSSTLPMTIIDFRAASKVPEGLIPEEMAKFNPHGNKGSFDGLDCLADAFLADKDGTICPSPPAPAGHYGKTLAPTEAAQEWLREKIREAKEMADGVSSNVYG